MTSAPTSTKRDAELALLVAEAGQCRGDWRGDDGAHAKVRLPDHGIDVAQRRRFGGNDVDVDAQPVGVEPDRLLHALRPVDRVERRMRMEHDLAVAVDGILAGTHQLVDVGLLDGMAAKLDLDIGDVADEPSGAVAGPHLLDGLAGHALGKLDRLAHRMFARGHVGDEAALDAAALALAGAEHGQAAFVVRARDDRADLRRADVECRDGRPLGAVRHWGSALLRRRRGRRRSDRFARRARQANGHLVRARPIAQIELQDAAAKQSV